MSAGSVDQGGPTPKGADAHISAPTAGHLPDDAVVVRGGEVTRRSLEKSARLYEASYPGEYALSFWSWPQLSADDIALRAAMPHPRYRKSTAGRIRNLAVSDGRPLDLVRTGPRDGHYTLRLPAPPTDDDMDALRGAFDPSQPNPASAEEVS